MMDSGSNYVALVVGVPLYANFYHSIRLREADQHRLFIALDAWLRVFKWFAVDPSIVSQNGFDLLKANPVLLKL